jgi:hypothetical protein
MFAESRVWTSTPPPVQYVPLDPAINPDYRQPDIRAIPLPAATSILELFSRVDRAGESTPEPREGRSSEQEIEIMPLISLQHMCAVEGLVPARRRLHGTGQKKAAPSVPRGRPAGPAHWYRQ